MQNGITIIGGNGQGVRLDQLSLPYSIFIDDDQMIELFRGNLVKRMEQ